MSEHVERQSTNNVARLSWQGVQLAQRVGQDLHGFASSLTRRGVRENVRRELTRDDVTRLGGILARAETNLADDLLPFWTRHTWDEDSGGFITHLDREGRRLGPTEKCLVSQAGTIWALAAAHRHGLDRCGYLELAGRGVQFLLDRMWDPAHDGFVWKVARDGRHVDARKDVCGHALAIYALAEYALASGDASALTAASTVFDQLQDRAADGPDGFVENFTREWTPALTGRDHQKTLLTHCHLMEAFTRLALVSRSPIHRAAVEQVLTLLLDKAIHPIDRCATESFDRQWRSMAGRFAPTITWYGLNVTLAWLMLDAADLVGQRDRVRHVVLGLIDHALAEGFDRERGGLARYGPRRGHVTHALYFDSRRLEKLWWVQAEFLVATMEAYCLTDDATYLDAFEKQFDWIWNHQIDHEAGGWFEATTWHHGRPTGFNKGDDWRCLFHETRALIRVSRALRTIDTRR